jgi:hypothetical protein
MQGDNWGAIGRFVRGILMEKSLGSKNGKVEVSGKGMESPSDENLCRACCQRISDGGDVQRST